MNNSVLRHDPDLLARDLLIEKCKNNGSNIIFNIDKFLSNLQKLDHSYLINNAAWFSSPFFPNGFPKFSDETSFPQRSIEGFENDQSDEYYRTIVREGLESYRFFIQKIMEGKSIKVKRHIGGVNIYSLNESNDRITNVLQYLDEQENKLKAPVHGKVTNILEWKAKRNS